MIAAAVLLIMTPLFKNIYYNVRMDKLLKNIPCESENIPYIMEFGTLHTPDKEISLEYLLSEETGDENVRIYEVFCVTNGKAYFVYEATEWILTSFDLSTEEFELCCSFSGGETRYGYTLDSDRFSEYGKRHGYYLDGKIILNNYTDVLVFDVRSETHEKIPYEEYSFPKYVPLCEVENIGGEQKLTLFSEFGERSFTLADMAKTSEGIAAVYSLKGPSHLGQRLYLSGQIFISNVGQKYGW